MVCMDTDIGSANYIEYSLQTGDKFVHLINIAPSLCFGSLLTAKLRFFPSILNL